MMTNNVNIPEKKSQDCGPNAPDDPIEDVLGLGQERMRSPDPDLLQSSVIEMVINPTFDFSMGEARQDLLDSGLDLLGSNAIDARFLGAMGPQANGGSPEALHQEWSNEVDPTTSFSRQNSEDCKHELLYHHEGTNGMNGFRLKNPVNRGNDRYPGSAAQWGDMPMPMPNEDQPDWRQDHQDFPKNGDGNGTSGFNRSQPAQGKASSDPNQGRNVHEPDQSGAWGQWPEHGQEFGPQRGFVAGNADGFYDDFCQEEDNGVKSDSRHDRGNSPRDSNTQYKQAVDTVKGTS